MQDNGFFQQVEDAVRDAAVRLKDATTLSDVKEVFTLLEPFVLWPLVDKIGHAAEGTPLSTLVPIGGNVLNDTAEVLSKAAEVENLLDGSELDDTTYEGVIYDMQSLVIEFCGLFPEISKPLAEIQETEMDPEFWS